MRPHYLLILSILVPTPLVAQVFPEPTQTPRSGTSPLRLFRRQATPTPSVPEQMPGILEPTYMGQQTPRQPAASPTPRRQREPSRPARETPEREKQTPKPTKAAAAEKTPKETEPPERRELLRQSDVVTTTVAGFLEAANNGFYSRALTYLTPQYQK